MVFVGLRVDKFLDFLLSIVYFFSFKFFCTDSGGILSSGDSASYGLSDGRESLDTHVGDNEDSDGHQDTKKEQIIFSEGQSPSMHSYQNIGQIRAEGKPVVHSSNQIVALVSVVQGYGKHQGGEVYSWSIEGSLVSEIALLSILRVTA